MNVNVMKHLILDTYNWCLFWSVHRSPTLRWNGGHNLWINNSKELKLTNIIIIKTQNKYLAFIIPYNIYVWHGSVHARHSSITIRIRWADVMYSLAPSHRHMTTHIDMISWWETGIIIGFTYGKTVSGPRISHCIHHSKILIIINFI